jgi:hypothetical protein
LFAANSRDGAGFVLDGAVAAALYAQLPVVAERTVASVTAQIAEYAALDSSLGSTIQDAVQIALTAFLRLAAQTDESDAAIPMRPALDGAYALGRGEARSGRTMDALLGAYRVGARVAWRELSSTAVAFGLGAASLARFAELVFAYIDELSAASAAGHTEELARTGRVREQYLARLGVALLDGATEESLRIAADRAGWAVPETLTAVLVPEGQARSALAGLPPATLLVAHDLAGLDEHAVLLVRDAGRGRVSLLSGLRGRAAVVGPDRPWTAVRTSFLRAVRCLELPGEHGLIDTERHLLSLVLTADAEALEDLRAGALAPLAAVRPATAARLVETLRSWLLHQGRRADIAADLVVHPQTVRYRMTQLRELFGDRLIDPQHVASLMVALAEDRPVAGSSDVGAGEPREG